MICLRAILLSSFVLCCVRAPVAAQNDLSFQIGQTLEGFTLSDLDGAPQTLKDYPYQNALVIVFFSTECPTSSKYRPHLAQIHTDYGPRGVRLIAVNANYSEPLEEIIAYNRQNQFPFPVLKDPDHRLADYLNAKNTPHAFLFDARQKLRYHGEIDNGFGIEKYTTSRGLWEALDALLAGREIERPVVRPFGCIIRRGPEKAVVAPSENTPTFTRDILPFLQERCQDCHHSGGIGRVPFLDYREVQAWATDMRDSIRSQTMPPWNARPEVGDFLGDRHLSQSEIDRFSQWIDAGMPKGDSAHRPPPKTFSDTWTLGTPDVILVSDTPYAVEASGPDEYRCFVIPLNLPKDQYVTGIEILPDAREVVHHVSVYIDVSGRASALQDTDPKPGYPSFGGVGFPVFGPLGGWAPGNTPFLLPGGVARFLPANSDIVMQVHYHKTGKAVQDRSQLGIYLAKKPVEKQLREVKVSGRLVLIPPNVKRHKITGSTTIAHDAQLLGILPHMHLLGTEIKLTATYPDGTVIPLVWVNPWDFDWQETYVYKTPISLPRGTRIHMEAYYDNTTDNPRNPNNPPKFVRYGENSADEMCVAFLYVTHDSENLLNRAQK